MNSPRDGSRVKPLTPLPVLSTNCKIKSKQHFLQASIIKKQNRFKFLQTLINGDERLFSNRAGASVHTITGRYEIISGL